MAPSMTSFDGDNGTREGTRPTVVDLRFREVVTVAIGLAGAPLGLMFVLTRPQLEAMALTLGGGIIYVACLFVGALSFLVSYNDLRTTEDILRGLRPLTISDQGIALAPKAAPSAEGAGIKIRWDEIESIEISGLYEFRVIRDIVFVLASGSRISAGYRQSDEGLALARSISARWPGKCVFKHSIGGRSCPNPFLEPRPMG
jgi:hypothetical protein